MMFKSIALATTLAVASCSAVPAFANDHAHANCSSSDVLKGVVIGATVGGVIAYFGNQPYLNSIKVVSGPMTNLTHTGRTVGEMGGWRAFKGVRHVQYATTGIVATYGAAAGAWTGCAYNELIRNNDLRFSDLPGLFRGDSVQPTSGGYTANF
jgi:hypothetical protein